jgi:hypothetical protein
MRLWPFAVCVPLHVPRNLEPAIASNECDGHPAFDSPRYIPRHIDEEFGSIVGDDHDFVTAEVENAAFLSHRRTRQTSLVR